MFTEKINIIYLINGVYNFLLPVLLQYLKIDDNINFDILLSNNLLPSMINNNKILKIYIVYKLIKI